MGGARPCLSGSPKASQSCKPPIFFRFCPVRYAQVTFFLRPQVPATVTLAFAAATPSCKQLIFRE